MNRLAMGVLALLAVAGAASAATVSCPDPPNPGVPMNAVGLAAYCGGVSFSNFQVLPFRDNKADLVYLGGISVGDKWVSLWFNPGAGGASGSGALYMAGDDRGAGGGLVAGVSDTACSALIPTAGRKAELCPESTLLASIVAASGKPNDNAERIFEATKTGWAVKDFSARKDSENPGGRGAHSLTEDSDNTAIPEPSALLLAGPALLSLLWLRRRKAGA